MDFVKDNIEVQIDVFGKLKNRKKETPVIEYCRYNGYKESNDFEKYLPEMTEYKKGTQIGEREAHYLFHFTVSPIETEETENKEYALSFRTGREGEWDATNPQGLLVLNGRTLGGIDTNHTEIPIEAGVPYDCYVYLYCGMDGSKFAFDAFVSETDVRIKELYYDLKVPFECLQTLEEGSREYLKIRDTLDRALMLTDMRGKGTRDTCRKAMRGGSGKIEHPQTEEFFDGVLRASEYIKKNLINVPCEPTRPVVSCIGHTHIDVAWLWTVAQTREKTERSFSTALRLMREYPEYKFMSSQPQLYEFFKETEPELYEEIKERVKEGRWEVEGAMWLESDTNLPSGESLIRQILRGKRFMKKEFGTESRILWLPDTFGYNPILPQILRKSGIDRFFTTKLYWNETNKLPDDLFIWKGIDGSGVFTSIIPSYVSDAKPSKIAFFGDSFKNKNLTDTMLLTMGFGDGGGGTTAEMLEYCRRMKNGLPGMPRVEIAKAGDYFDKAESDFVKNTEELHSVPVWNGELYLEKHRGTYTSAANNKKNNRKSEILFRETEALSVLSMKLFSEKYESELLEKREKTLLLDQFHDILPGSAIKEVYDVTDKDYELIVGDLCRLSDEKLHSIAENVGAKGLLVYNPSPFETSGEVTNGGKTYFAQNVPAHGWKVISENDAAAYDTAETDKFTLENELVRVIFDENYDIASVYDKETGRELVENGKRANVLEFYEDMPEDYDAWDISEYYMRKKYFCDGVLSVKSVPNGICVKKKYHFSTIEQTITLVRGSKRIDFATKVDWQEDHTLMRASFPLDVRADYATYDVGFGSVTRPSHGNTSWDRVKFEVCGHKWADLSEYGFGAAILTDSKYGYSCRENVLSVSLLKSAVFPNPVSDIGTHEFTYSLFPHTGDYRSGHVVRESYALNMPLICVPCGGNGKLPAEYSGIFCNAENVVAETIKKAEDSDGVIVRLYDAFDAKTDATVTAGFDFEKAYVCDLMENELYALEKNGRSVNVHVGNFEIVTLKFV